MLEKIKAEIKTKFSNLGLSDEAINGVASLLVGTVTEESQIANVVSTAEPALKSFQSTVDKRVGDLSREKTQLETEKSELQEKLEGIGKPPETPPAGSEDNKTLELLQKLQDKIEGFENKQTQDKQNQDRQALIESATRKMIDEKGADEKFVRKALKLISISDEDNIDAIVEKGIAEVNDLQSTFTPQGGPTRNPQPQDIDTMVGEFFKQMKSERES